MGTRNSLSLLGFILVSPICMAQSIINGTWRPDPEIYGANRKPDVVELANGVYRCQSCMPPSKVKADGQDQPISGKPYYDTPSITPVDARTVKKIAK
jgi:hypothetical protein